MKYLFYDFHVSHRSFWYLINLVAKVMSVHIFLARSVPMVSCKNLHLTGCILAENLAGKAQTPLEATKF